MNCSKCGYQLTNEDKFCPSCGNPVSMLNNNQQNQAPVIEELDGDVVSSNNMMNNNIQQPMNNNMMGNNIQQPINNNMMGNNIQQPINNNMMNNNIQQPMNNNMMGNNMQQPMKNTSNNKIGILYIIVGVIAVVIVIALILGGKGDEESNQSGESGNATTVATTASYKVQYDNYSFTIPDNIVSDQMEGELLVGDESKGWIASMSIIDKSFNEVKANKSNIKSNLGLKGITAKDAQLKTIKGVEVVTVEFSTQGINCIGFYTKVSAKQIVAAITYNEDNEFDYSVLDTIVPIISSAKRVSESNSLTTKPELKGLLDFK